MRRENTPIKRLELERKAPLVPCAYAEGRQDQWKGRVGSCGELIPFKPRTPCPSCGQIQVRANPRHPADDDLVLREDTAIVDARTGEVVVVYMVPAKRLATQLANALARVGWEQGGWDRDFFGPNASTTTRLSGVVVTHATFGYQPPVPMRRRWACCRSQFNDKNPDAMAVLTEFCRLAEHVFRIQASEVHDRTASRVRDLIAPAWLIGGTPWTSGVINKTAALPYHRDQSNVPGSWSAMLGCRREVEGGMLHLADYNVYLPVEHGSITIMDGQSVTHGVTPLRLKASRGFRYTVVTYAKTAMGKCSPDPADELRRAQIAATEAEEAKRTHLTASGPRR